MVGDQINFSYAEGGQGMKDGCKALNRDALMIVKRESHIIDGLLNGRKLG